MSESDHAQFHPVLDLKLDPTLGCVCHRDKSVLLRHGQADIHDQDVGHLAGLSAHQDKGGVGVGDVRIGGIEVVRKVRAGRDDVPGAATVAEEVLLAGLADVMVVFL
jgi:hypothetical protein